MHLVAETLSSSPVREIGSRCGEARVEIQNVAGKSVVVRARAQSPLKLLSPRTTGNAAWLFTSTFGGGLLGGDTIELSLVAGANTRCLLSTQASTKIYRTVGPVSQQNLDVRIGKGAIVVSAPDPVVCFAGSRFQQRQRFDLAAGAGLVMLDSLTSGRRARGERWAFDRYESTIEIFNETRCVFRDAVLLDPIHGPIAAAMRMGLFDCVATLVIIGEPLELFGREVLDFVASQSVSRDALLLFAASPIAGGVVVRVAGMDTETVMRWIEQRLSFVTELIGENPWSRKW